MCGENEKNEEVNLEEEFLLLTKCFRLNVCMYVSKITLFELFVYLLMKFSKTFVENLLQKILN